MFSGIRTECPSGTKCVADFFCNENAIMVNHRVNLTPAQKRKRGSLTVSTNYDLAPANLNADPNFRGVDLSIVNREKKLDLELIGSSLRIQ